MDCIDQSLARFLLLASLSPPLIGHQPRDPSHSPAWSFLVFTGSFLFVRNPAHFEHFHVVVSKMEYNGPLDLGEGKQR